MSKLKLTLPETPITGKQISFKAPCHSTDITGLVINGEEYSLVDASGVSVAGLAYAWEENAMVSVILNVDTHTAFIQNASPTAYLETTVLEIKNGGTGATTKEGALVNLGGAQIKIGSYVGTGTYGADNPNSLTFDFEPKLVMITGGINALNGSRQLSMAYDGQNAILDCRLLSTEYTPNTGLGMTGDGNYGKKEGNTLYWYHTKASYNQYNSAEFTYYWVAIG